jgi:hypothetical protein
MKVRDKTFTFFIFFIFWAIFVNQHREKAGLPPKLKQTNQFFLNKNGQ